VATAEPSALVQAVAGYGLPGTSPTLSREPLDDAVWAKLLDLVQVQRVTGFLIRAVDDRALATRADQATEAALAHRAEMTWALLIESFLLETADRLTNAGIAFRVLKGTTAAHLDYPSPEVRSFGDVDLLVRSEQFDAAVGELLAAGHRRRFPQPRPGFDRRFSKGTSFVAHDGKEIDLHRTFAMGSFGLSIKLDDLWARSSSYLLGDVLLHGLAREERFLHACFHAALGDFPPRLAALRDVAQLLLGGEVDLHLVRALAASWRSDVVVARALQSAWRSFDLDASVSPLTAWALDFVPSAKEQRALAAYAGAEARYASRSAAGLRAVPGVRDKAAYLRALAFPEREYVEPRYHSRVDRLRRNASAVWRRVEWP
jgi:hypothetical protein